MTIQNIIVNGTDTLGQGEKCADTSYTRHTGFRLAINVSERDVIGADFAEFDRHLTRLLGRGQWHYERLYSGPFDRRYYFRNDRDVELESEPLATPGTPVNVAALVGDDPYTTPGDINFLLKGDRFRAEKDLPGGRKKVAYGTAAMDGNAISHTHGWLIFEAEGMATSAAAKRKAYDNIEGGYINVHWDYREPGAYDASVQAQPQRGSTPAVGYKPAGEYWPNEGLNLRDGWKIYVLPEVAKRKTKALGEARKRRQRTEAEAGLTKAQQALNDAKSAVQAAERKLELAQNELRNL